MGRAAASLGLFPLAADASISCAASLLCFTDVRRDKLLASLFARRIRGLHYRPRGNGAAAANQPRRVMKTIAFVSWQIVDDDDISGPQRWRQRRSSVSF